jgi:hypothetical protein
MDAQSVQERLVGRRFHITRLVIEREESEPRSLSISMKLVSAGDDEVLELVCQGCRDVRVRDVESISAVVLEVEDIASRGWEDLRLRVRDIEEDVLLFYCREIVASP